MESQGNNEFLLGIEEYLNGLGCKEDAAKIHAVARALSKNNDRESIIRTYLQDLTAVLSETDKPLADLIHRFLSTKNVSLVYDAILHYVMNQPTIEQNLKDYIFRIIKVSQNKEELYSNTIKFLANSKELTRDTEDLLHKIVKLESDNETKIVLLRYVMTLDFLDQKTKDFIFKIVKDAKDHIQILLHFLAQTLEKNLANLANALSKTTEENDFVNVFIKHHLIGLQDEYPGDKLFRGINSCVKNNLLSQEILNDAFSRSQMRSKFWLVKELANISKDYKNVLVMAGWFGQVKSIYEKFLSYKKMRILDLDRVSCEVSDYVFNLSNLENHKVKSITADITNLSLHKNGYEWLVENFKEPDKNYTEKFLPDLIINTSAEHMSEDWFHQIRFKQLDSNPIVAIQSNNMFNIDEHVNCVHSIDHMKKKFPMKEILYEGELQLKGYKRVMLIGRP